MHGGYCYCKAKSPLLPSSLCHLGLTSSVPVPSDHAIDVLITCVITGWPAAAVQQRTSWALLHWDGRAGRVRRNTTVYLSTQSTSPSAEGTGHETSNGCVRYCLAERPTWRFVSPSQWQMNSRTRTTWLHSMVSSWGKTPPPILIYGLALLLFLIIYRSTGCSVEHKHYPPSHPRTWTPKTPTICTRAHTFFLPSPASI